MTWPQIAGRCPVCRGPLFLGVGGHITCSYIECPNPTLVADMAETWQYDANHRTLYSNLRATDVIGRGGSDGVHACPPNDSGVFPCCRQTPFEVPRWHRMTLDPALVTCQPTDATGRGGSDA